METALDIAQSLGPFRSLCATTLLNAATRLHALGVVALGEHRERTWRRASHVGSPGRCPHARSEVSMKHCNYTAWLLLVS